MDGSAAAWRARRAVVIYNPAAGQRRRRRLAAALEELARLNCLVELRPTDGPGDAEALAHAAAGESPDVVVAAGGDGTINEVVNGLIRAPAAPPLAVIPLGTANVLAWELGLKGRPRAIARAIVHGRRRSLHLGLVNGRHFVLMVGVGVDARAVAGVSGALKSRTGRLAYLVAATQSVLRYGFPVCRAIVDGEEHAARSVVVMNGRCYGGPFVPAPEAGVDKPGFQVVLMKNGGLWHALRYGAALVLGRLHRLRDVEVLPGREVRITGEAGAPVQADGDLVATLPAEVTVADRVLDLVWP